MLKLIRFFLLLINMNLNAYKAIIWDLDGVLVYSSRLKMAQNIGISNFFNYMFYDWKNPNVELLVLETLSKFDKDYDDILLLKMPDGTPIPKIMTSWMSGGISGQDILNKYKELKQQLIEDKQFISPYQEKVISKTIKSIFTPELFSATVQINKRGLGLVKKLTRKYDNYILSNWDIDSFDRVCNSNQSLFKLFKKDNIFISGKCNLAKPDEKIYKYFLDKAKLKPEECIFIDDTLENVETANKLGIKGIWLQNNNYDNLKSELINLGVL